MKTFWNSLIGAFGVYSIVPMPNVELSKEDVKYSMCFVPLVGAVIGAILCGWRMAYPYLCNGNFLPAVVFVIVPVIVSGGVHLDGFIDVVDAICSHKTMERKLEILRDTHTGAFALIMTISYFLIALGVWSEMPINAVPVLAFGFVMSRALGGLAIILFPRAKASKRLESIQDAKTKKILIVTMAVYVVVCAVLMCYLEPLYGSVGVFGAAISYAYYYYVSKKHFGGITRAVTGYFIQICELIIPCMVLIAWKFL